MQPTITDLKELLTRRQGPCVSLHQPTHRRHPDHRQDPIRFANLVREIETGLQERYASYSADEILQPLRTLAGDENFWRHQRDGLAVFAAPGLFRVYLLQRTSPERAVVADSFHVKPLLRYLQSADRFHVLAFSRDRARLFEGNRYALDEEDLPEDFPAERAMVVPPPSTEPGVSVASTSGPGSPKMMRGHGEGKEDQDVEKFHRALDRAVTDSFSKPSGLPLILAALPENQAEFRKISRNPALLPEGVAADAAAMDLDSLRQKAWQVLEPHYLARLERLKDQFGTAQARQAGSGDLSDVARAAVAGRVANILLEAGRVVPGILDPETGAIRQGTTEAPDTGEMLDDLAELVLAQGGEVVVVPPERMPTDSGLAATFRY